MSICRTILHENLRKNFTKKAGCIPVVRRRSQVFSVNFCWPGSCSVGHFLQLHLSKKVNWTKVIWRKFLRIYSNRYMYVFFCSQQHPSHCSGGKCSKNAFGNQWKFPEREGSLSRFGLPKKMAYGSKYPFFSLVQLPLEMIFAFVETRNSRRRIGSCRVLGQWRSLSVRYFYFFSYLYFNSFDYYQSHSQSFEGW